MQHSVGRDPEHSARLNHSFLKMVTPSLKSHMQAQTNASQLNNTISEVGESFKQLWDRNQKKRLQDNWQDTRNLQSFMRTRLDRNKRRIFKEILV